MKDSSKKFAFRNEAAYEYMSKALSCHALCLLSEAGLLERLSKGNSLGVEDINQLSNSPLVETALITLAGAGLLDYSKGQYQLTDIGMQLSNDISLLSLPFIGYRKLLAKQYELLNCPNDWKDEEIDFESIAAYSVGFGEENVNAELEKIFDRISLRGTICDLGCGTGAKLLEFCNKYGVSGLGIDKDSQVIISAKREHSRRSNLEFITADINSLEGIWEDVEVVMSNFVFHDVANAKDYKMLLNSITEKFPRCRCIIVTDIVSYSEKCPSIMPGFDYVHGLQGFVPRSLEETLEVFEMSGMQVLEQVSVEGMKNTFVWVLQPS